MFDLPMIGIDTHAHLDLEPFLQDREEVVQRAGQNGLERIGNVFLGPDAYTNRPSALDSDPKFFFILGVHPHDSSQADQNTIQAIETFICSDSRIRAIGEIGLDFFWMHSPKQKQRMIFKEQLSLAKFLDCPVVIHSRDAEDECLSILLDMGFHNRPLLWHCFNRDSQFANQILTNGWTISVPGIVTYKTASYLQEASKHIPLSRMVIETDSPFLPPEPHRKKRNEPAFIVHTAQKIASLQGKPLEKVWEKTAHNAREFFQLAPSSDKA